MKESLSTKPLESPSMDYAFLRKEGIGHLEKLAGKLWTDFNAHDPGITILEQLCYALTDLGYRINYNIPDLLAEPQGKGVDGLFTPRQILTTRPVTLTDLRKVAIDVEGVRNAWIEKVDTSAKTADELNMPLYFNANQSTISFEGDPLTSTPVHLKGLYNVYIEISELLDTEKQSTILRKVIQRLHANRGLCEDFVNIEILEPEKIQVHARIEIDAIDDPEDVLVQIYRKLADHISPPVQFYSLEQLVEEGKPIDEIFEGPELERGFIDSEQLKQARRRTVLHASDFVREIMDIRGVRAVRSINLSNGANSNSWSLNVNSQNTPRLDIEASTISLERNGLPSSFDIKGARELYYQHLRQSSAFRRPLPEDLDYKPTQGRDRKVAQYHSFQHQFPATYGIGEMGLPKSATPERKTQARQLKAYLLFFDQLLANYFAQIANAKELFSVSSETECTYFSNIIDDPTLGIDGIRKGTLEAHKECLHRITETPKPRNKEEPIRHELQRRNRFLNHLLARFGEQFTDYSLVLYGVMSEQKNSVEEKLAKDKALFLQKYPRISSRRGTGLNYLFPAEGDNISGLQQRIERILGLDEKQDERVFVIEHILLRPMPEDVKQKSPLLVDTSRADPFSLQLSFVFPNWPSRFNQNKRSYRKFIEQTVRGETPAYLVPTIHWLTPPEMEQFKKSYADWLEKRRLFWTQNKESYANWLEKRRLIWKQNSK